MIPVTIVVILVVLTHFILFGIPGSSDYLGWKLAGIWSNQSETLQIMIHEQDARLSGHVVSAEVRGANSRIVVGKMVVDNVKLRPVWNWSSGKYIDPYTMEEFDFKIKLKSNNTLKVCYMEKENLVRKEEWKLVNPL